MIDNQTGHGVDKLAKFLDNAATPATKPGVASVFYIEHKAEIIFALIFSVAALFVVEVVKHPIKKIWVKVSRRFNVNKIKSVLKGVKALHEAEIERSMKSNYDGPVPTHFIVDAVKKHNAFTTATRVHFSDYFGKYHVWRRLNLFPVLNGEETFFDEMCSNMSKEIDFRGINLALSLKKDTNRLFAKEFLENFPPKIKNHTLIYDEKTSMGSGDHYSTVKYGEGESLEGTNVLILESLFIFPEPIMETIKEIRRQGANVNGLVILFDGSGGSVDFASFGLKPEDIIVGCRVDLKLFTHETCDCKKKSKSKLKVLRYDEY
jgi:hypothetical protein